MKLKGINPVEQHVEKIVLAVFALILLAVFAWQFVGNPNAVQVGQQTVSPDRAPDIVRDMARQVKGRLEASSAPNIPKQPSVLEEVKAGLEGRGAPPVPVSLAGVVGGASAPIITPTTPGAGDRPTSAFASFVPPSPQGIVAAVHEGTIDPLVPIEVKEAAEFLPAQQPLDLRSVSVQATIDASLVRAALSEPASGQPLPAQWWLSKVEVLDVELQRQTLNADGTWGADTTIAPFPGAPSLRTKINDPATRPVDLTAILDTEKAQRQFIRRPLYWNTISGAEWVMPSEALAGADQGTPAAAQAKLRIIKEQRERIARVEAALEKAGAGGRGNPGGPGGRDDGRGGGGGGGGGGADKPGGTARALPAPQFHQPTDASGWLAGLYAQASAAREPFGKNIFAQAGGGGGRPPQPPPPPPGANREDARRADLEKQKAAAQKMIDEAIAALETLGFDEKGQRLTTEKKDFAEPLTSLTETATQNITLWAHDPSAKPGATYRYRLVAWYTNPFFGNGAALDESQKSLASAAAIAGAPSEWTSPIVVAPSVRYILTSAREAGVVGGGNAALFSEASASGEIYEFFYGYWRKAGVEMRPGDRVMSTISLPPLNRYEIGVNESGRPDLAGMKTAPCETAREVSLDEYFVDAMPAAGGSGAEAVMRTAAVTLRLVRTGGKEDAGERAKLQASAAAGANAPPRLPGAKAAGTPGSPTGGGGYPGGPDSSRDGDRDERGGGPGGSGRPGDKPGG